MDTEVYDVPWRKAFNNLTLGDALLIASTRRKPHMWRVFRLREQESFDEPFRNRIRPVIRFQRQIHRIVHSRNITVEDLNATDWYACHWTVFLQAEQGLKDNDNYEIPL